MKHVIALAVLLANPAFGQQNLNCAERELAIEGLADNYGESRKSIGLSGNVVFEVFASTETGTWTIIATNTAGISCQIASGQSFEAINETVTKGDKI